MSQQIFTFSVSTKEQELLNFLNQLKKECYHTGRTFSWVCIKALQEYKQSAKSKAIQKRNKELQAKLQQQNALIKELANEQAKLLSFALGAFNE